MKVFRDAEGRLRWGWELVAFAALAGAVEALLVFLLSRFSLEPFGVDSWLMLTQTLPTLMAATVATTIISLSPRGGEGRGEGKTPRRRLPQLARGLLFGALTITLACAVPVVVGASTLRLGAGPYLEAGLIQLITLAPAGIGEELLLRGVAFQSLRRGLGDAWAVTLSGGVFGAMHLLNPHASPTAALIITLVGLWFGAVRVRSGTLWMPIGLHLAWNFFEGFVFGQPVSGLGPGTSLFVTTIGQPGFWSGGAFGPEAAGWTAVVLAAALGVTLAYRRSLT